MLKFAVPELTEADPVVAGEGSLDPLGLGPIGDRLAELLLPGITNRMRRPRFLTAMAVGAIATDGLELLAPVDGRSTPSICFEWLLLEAFERRRRLGIAPDELQGVPGSAKVAVAIAKGERLSLGNYLKTANVFGFTGVLMPLARSTHLLDRDRRAAERAADLVSIWQQEQKRDGFVEGARSTDGGKFRRAINEGVRQSLLAGRCEVKPGSSLFGDLAQTLRPSGAGDAERTWLSRALLDPSDETRQEIGLLVQAAPSDLGDRGLVELIRPRASALLGQRLDAVVAYEAVARRLESVLDEWQFRSTQWRSKPVTAGDVATREVVQAAAASLPDAIAAGRESIATVDPLLAADFDRLTSAFEGRTAQAALAEAVMHHHEQIQSAKPPNGKRPWFEPVDSGFVVRNLYRREDEPSGSFDRFNRQYRLAAFRNMLQELM